MKLTDSRHERFLLALSIILQGACLYLVPLVYECDGSMYFNYNPAGTYRPPVYAAFLALTGQHLFHSFWGTALAQGFLGVLSPLLMYRIVAPSHVRLALACATIYALSLVPFVAAKLMLTEQLFTFLVLGTFYALVQYQRSRQTRWLYATVVCGLLAMFTRWEGQVVLAFAGLALIATREWRHWRHGIAALGLILTIFIIWSGTRAYITADTRLFGSLHNGTGDQLFWRIYRYLPEHVGVWERRLGIHVSTKPSSSAAHHNSYVHLVRPENGPATTRLRATIVDIARKHPENTVFRGRRGGFLTDLGGDPERLADDIFSNPDDVYVFSVPAELRRELGPVETERLLLAVSREALFAHPAMLLSMAGEMASFYGVAFHPGILNAKSPRGILMAQWGEAHYIDVPFDIGQCASGTLPPRMVDEYRWDDNLPRPLRSFHIAVSMARDWVRNIVGTLVFVTWWFIPMSRQRWLYAAIALSAIVLTGIYGVLGGGAQARYEYAVLPLLMLATAGGIGGLTERLARVVFRRVPAAEAAKA